MKNEILIYYDEGSGEHSSKHLQKSLQIFFRDKYDVKLVDANTILSRKWQSRCKIICFGGGYDKGYLNKLKREGCEMIRKFIENGGIYIGICAGAYFACDYIEFDKNGPLEVVGERYLKFFKGIGYGPIFPGFEYNTSKGVHASCVYNANHMKLDKLDVFYKGGCAFRNCYNDDKTTILYKYALNDEAAIIHTKIGDGQALLSGVHYEYIPDDCNFEIEIKVRQKLNESNSSRLILLAELFENL